MSNTYLDNIVTELKKCIESKSNSFGFKLFGKTKCKIEYDDELNFNAFMNKEQHIGNGGTEYICHMAEKTFPNTKTRFRSHRGTEFHSFLVFDVEQNN